MPSPIPGPAHTCHVQQIIDSLEGNALQGLSDQEASRRQATYGPNQIKPPAKPSAIALLLRQIANAMTIVLLASMAVSFGTKDYVAGSVIGALVFLNVVVGFSQEWKAEKTVAALASVGSPTAVVVRHDSTKNGQGQAKTMDVEGVVPGDIILLVNGDIVPADARILPGYLSSLETDEAFLTGEALPVAKISAALNNADCPVGDKKNMVFSGSQVTKGRARCIVVATGMDTELGKIAEAMERKVKIKETGWAARWIRFKVLLGLAGTTPLQIKLNSVAYILLGVAILLAFIVVASTGFVKIPISLATYAIAVAVSILPASLIAVVSLTLANGSRELAMNNALVRRMDCIEALSGVTDICSDKTGTITLGKMVVKKAWVPTTSAFRSIEQLEIETAYGQFYDVESGSDPYYPRGAVRALPRQAGIEAVVEVDRDDDISSEEIIRPSEMEDAMKNLVVCSSLCNMATIHKGANGRWEAHGDATEIALQVFASKLGHSKAHLTEPNKKHPNANTLTPVTSRASYINPVQSQTGQKVEVGGLYEMLVEHPFDSSVKIMSTAWKFNAYHTAERSSELLLLLKGAVERVLDRCDFVGLGENQVKLDDRRRSDILSTMDLLAGEGLRVLALSARLIPDTHETEIQGMQRDDMERGFSFLGLVGIYDPPRPESRMAVLECKQAGITPRMLTGDHPATAAAIARAVGILDNVSPAGSVMTGQQFDALTEDEIDALSKLPLVVARCAPETKVRMVEAIHRRKIYGMHRTTIMTGDGVNDCPALKRADIGFAMGLNGSDVAKQVSDIVLADDNFSTITRAVKKGRGVLANLSKFLLFLLSGNISEVVLLLVGLAFKDTNGNSVYPISPALALYVNTIAAGPPALALGLERTASDAMLKNPGAYRTIFTLHWWLDLFFYGFLMGSLAVVNFVIVIWGTSFHGGKGTLGTVCNDSIIGFAEECENAYHGRATSFATLMTVILTHGFECKHLERGIFQVDLSDNKTLIWSSLVCWLSMFPIIYIPVINTYVFQLAPLSWEWGLVAAALVVYLLAAEMWKYARRSILRAAEDDGGPPITEKDLPRSETVFSGGE